MSENNNRHCYGCKYYKPYYIKGNIQFDRCDIGLCKRKKQTVDKNDICEEYSSMFYGRVKRRESALLAVIEHINILSELKQILEEDDEEAITELIFDYKRQKMK